jgi:protein-L-isoaspartate(D-aspartate) O-methyltransferase
VSFRSKQALWAAIAVVLVIGCRRSSDEVATSSPEAPTVPEKEMTTDASSKPTSGPAESSQPGDMLPGDSAEARKLRHRLVRSIESFDKPWGGGTWDARVLDAMRKVPRHLFMREHGLMSAYRDMPFPIGYDQTISQPTVVALMTQALDLSGDEKVLEIGTGSGYQAAVLSLLVKKLFTIEIVKPLGLQAKERLAALGYDNVTVRIGDGYAGWPEEAPFDRIILTAAPPSMPKALIAQLAEGGVIVAPVGEVEQDLVRWRKKGGALHKEVLGAVRFVPMVPGSSTPRKDE